MRRAALVISAMAVVILVAGGVALAKNISCPKRGNDVCLGTHNNDTMSGTNGADTIRARGGSDRVMARGGRDMAFGKKGSDALLGGPGNDRLNAGPNPDTALEFLSGGPGDDTLVESHGVDRYVFGAGWGNDTMIEDGDRPGEQPDSDEVCFFCGPGTVTGGVTIDLATGTATEGANTVTWDAPAIESATGGSGGDTITGSTRANFVSGNDGADTIDVSGDPSSGTDRVDCGAGDGDTDTVTKDPGDEISPNTCDGDVVTDVP